MADDDIQINKTMGKNGSVLFENNDTIMTHCNAGALATVAYGDCIRVLSEQQKRVEKMSKLLQQKPDLSNKVLRLTAFELKHDGFDVSLIPDTAVGYSMANGLSR